MPFGRMWASADPTSSPLPALRLPRQEGARKAPAAKKATHARRPPRRPDERLLGEDGPRLRGAPRHGRALRDDLPAGLAYSWPLADAQAIAARMGGTVIDSEGQPIES